MSELDIDAIKARLEDRSGLPVFLTDGDIAKTQENKQGVYRWYFHGTWDDAGFFAEAPEDIAALITEVERLRGQVNELATLWEAATDAVNLDTDARLGEWQTAFDWLVAKYHESGYRAGGQDSLTENTALQAQIDAVRAATANHPDPCEKHPDGDTVSCGWKNAYLDVVETLAC